MELIRVDYSRKVSPAQFETVSIGGSLEFKPTSDDIQAEFDKNLLVLKMIVDAQLSQQQPMSGGVFDKIEKEPDLGEEPDWVKKNREDREKIESDLPEMKAPKEEKPEESKVFLGKAKVFRSEFKKSPRTNKVWAEIRIGHDDLPAHINDQYVTVKAWDPEPMSAIGTRKRMKNEDTGEVEDIDQLNINKGDFVDVWGFFSPWKSDPSKSDLVAQVIKKSE